MKYSSGESCGWVELWFEVQRKGPCARDAELGVIIKVIVRPWKFQTFDKTYMIFQQSSVFSYWHDSPWLCEGHQPCRGVCHLWHSRSSTWSPLSFRHFSGLGEDKTSLREASSKSQTESAPLLPLPLCSPSADQCQIILTRMWTDPWSLTHHALEKETKYSWCFCFCALGYSISPCLYLPVWLHTFGRD